MRQSIWTPGEIIWQETGEDGTRYALLEGSRGAGPFSYAFFIPAGFWDAPHWHSQDARVFVVSGALWLGQGRDFDRSTLARHAAGTFLLIPGEMPHFDGSEEDTLIIGVASGPWTTTYADPAHQPSAGTPRQSSSQLPKELPNEQS
jgi:hypothetical protein